MKRQDGLAFLRYSGKHVAGRYRRKPLAVQGISSMSLMATEVSEQIVSSVVGFGDYLAPFSLVTETCLYV